MKTQLEFIKSSKVPAASINFHCCFLKEDKLYMRVKPIGFILTSNLLNDVINRGDIFVVDLTTGNMRAYQGCIDVEPVDIIISIKLEGE